MKTAQVTNRERRHFIRRRQGNSRRVFQHAGRRFRAIALKANTEPTELLISLSMLQSAVVLVFFQAVPPLPFPAFFGHALGCLGLVGVMGLGLRNGALRLGFAFFGLIIRAWMAMLYILRDWHDPAWVSLVMAAVALGWILVRVRCLLPCPWLVLPASRSYRRSLRRGPIIREGQ